MWLELTLWLVLEHVFVWRLKLALLVLSYYLSVYVVWVSWNCFCVVSRYEGLACEHWSMPVRSILLFNELKSTKYVICNQGEVLDILFKKSAVVWSFVVRYYCWCLR